MFRNKMFQKHMLNENNMSFNVFMWISGAFCCFIQ